MNSVSQAPWSYCEVKGLRRVELSHRSVPGGDPLVLRTGLNELVDGSQKIVDETSGRDGKDVLLAAGSVGHWLKVCHTHIAGTDGYRVRSLAHVAQPTQ